MRPERAHGLAKDVEQELHAVHGVRAGPKQSSNVDSKLHNPVDTERFLTAHHCLNL